MRKILSAKPENNPLADLDWKWEPTAFARGREIIEAFLNLSDQEDRPTVDVLLSDTGLLYWPCSCQRVELRPQALSFAKNLLTGRLSISDE